MIYYINTHKLYIIYIDMIYYINIYICIYMIYIYFPIPIKSTGFLCMYFAEPSSLPVAPCSATRKIVGGAQLFGPTRPAAWTCLAAQLP